jgi:prepilin-type N-terminal cleavage/methylation domain-containing protein
MRRTHSKDLHSSRGISLLELIIVVAITGILSAIAIPQMMSQRRLTRAGAVTREIQTQMRYARQLAMSQYKATPTGSLRRVAYTFQYDDSTKQIKVIGPIPAGTTALPPNDALYPNNTGSSAVLTVSLTQGGLSASEISSGIPASLPGSPTTVDTVAGVALAGGKLNVTFQPDGSVINGTGVPVENALFIYDNLAPGATASAISVRGSSGRVKIWRYSTNVGSYIE